MENILKGLDHIAQKDRTTYPNQGHEYILCRKRLKLLRATNEETVRQNFLDYLLDIEKIHPDLIEVEYHVNKVRKGSNKDRTDLILFGDATIDQPKVVIEFKAEIVAITGKTLAQAKRYAKQIGAEYLVLYNGFQFEGYIMDENETKNIEFESFAELLNSNYTVSETAFQWKKSSEAELANEAFIDEYVNSYWNGLGIEHRYILSNDTQKDILPYIIRLIDYIFDVGNAFTAIKPKLSEIILNQGIIPWSYSAYGGHSFDEHYRSVLLKDKKTGDVFSCKFAIYSYDLFNQITNQEQPSSYRGTYFMVGIDFGEYSSHSLELKLDKYGSIIANKGFVISHDGAITIKVRKTNSLTVDYVAEHSPHLIKDGKIFLGVLPPKGPYSPNDSAVCNFMANVIDYAYLRYKLRMMYT